MEQINDNSIISSNFAILKSRIQNDSEFKYKISVSPYSNNTNLNALILTPSDRLVFPEWGCDKFRLIEHLSYGLMSIQCPKLKREMNKSTNYVGGWKANKPTSFSNFLKVIKFSQHPSSEMSGTKSDKLIIPNLLNILSLIRLEKVDVNTLGPEKRVKLYSLCFKDVAYVVDTSSDYFQERFPNDKNLCFDSGSSTHYQACQFPFGLPSEFISAVCLPFEAIYCDSVTKEVFEQILFKKTIISPDGAVLFEPNNHPLNSKTFNVYKSRKDAYLRQLENRVGYNKGDKMLSKSEFEK